MSNKSSSSSFLLDKKVHQELSYDELENVDRTNKILWVHFDYSSKEANDWITNKKWN